MKDRDVVKLGWISSSQFNQTLSFYDPDGLCPTQWANQGKDPIKILVRGARE